MSASVALLVSVGGITRLTRSGLSMVEWKPVTGWLPPLNQEQWAAEFEKYKAFPEFQMINSQMSMEEFKKIFFWEYFHRLLGRLVGVGFAAGMIYHRRVLRGKLLAGCVGLLLGIGAQGALGWFMVKSGLEHNTLSHEPRVAATRLAAHLGAAFLLFSGMMWMGLGQFLSPHAPIAALTAARPALPSLMATLTTNAMVFTTAISGALMAGIRAGHVYNTFPLMGGYVIPPEYLDLVPRHRNFLENDACVQFNHRALAISTYLAITGLYWRLFRQRAVLPKRVMIAAHHLFALANVQVALGISTLLLVVPTSLAAAHQLGSLAVLSSALWLLKELQLVRLAIPRL
jgi:cytochrome c oxidase assembly protein subunit 15